MSRFFDATHLLLLLCVFSYSTAGFSQDFLEVPEGILGVVKNPTIAFGDIDGDSDLDVFIVGEETPGVYGSRLYFNDGMGAFTAAVGTSLPGVRSSDVKLIDVDSDNDLDLFLYGMLGTVGVVKLYLNNGKGQFSEMENTPFPHIKNGTIGVADFNSDSLPDIFIVGDSGSGYVVRMFLNSGQGEFSEVMEDVFLGVVSPSIAFGDIDGDNDPDVVISGITKAAVINTSLYINDSGNFSKVTNASFAHLFSGDMEFADVDGDGDQDFIQTGKGASGVIAKLFFNDGTGIFMEAPDFELDWVTRPRMGISDLDGDSDLDIFLVGVHNSNLYLNNGFGSYIKNTNYSFPKVTLGSVAIGQFNGQGLDDIILSGLSMDGDLRTWVLLNTTAVTYPPMVSDIAVSGNMEVEEVLLGSYSYSGSDTNEDSSTFKWYRSHDISGATKVTIPGADTIQYTLTSEDDGMFIQFEVTPYDGLQEGIPVQSEWYGPIKALLAEIMVKGNNKELKSGENSTAMGNHTDFGAIHPGDVLSRTYTIGNSGRAALTIGEFLIKGVNAADFRLSVFPSTDTILPGKEVDFTIEFIPSEIGVRDATLQINNNGLSNTLFQFAISGRGLNRTPVFSSPDTVDFLENDSDIVLDINATDGEGGETDKGISFLITGGADNDKFVIDQKSGYLTFIDPPDFEDPVDADQDNLYTIEITADDGQEENNVTSQLISIIVLNHDEHPIANCVKAFTANLDENGMLFLSAEDINNGSTDDSEDFVVSIDKTEFTWKEIGENEVILTVTDSNGNAASCSTIVTVGDIAPPVVKAKDITVYLDSLGQATIKVADIDDGSGDAGGIASFTVFPEFFTCSEIGSNTVTLTLTDMRNNSSSATSNVQVVDNSPPIIAPVDDILVDFQGAECGAYLEIVAPDVRDNCSVKYVEGVRSDGLALAKIFPIGETIIKWSAMDEMGNTAEPVNQKINVEKNSSREVDLIVLSTSKEVGSPVEVEARFTGGSASQIIWQAKEGQKVVQEFIDENVAESYSEHIFRNLPSGVYTIRFVLSDYCGNTFQKEFEYVTIYDPSGGFLTGGGSIDSPPGAFLSDPSLTGKASFSINAKYQGGRNNSSDVKGNNIFQLKTGKLDFKSTSIEKNSLVISEGYKASFRGAGILNGKVGFNYFISVIDAENKSGLKKDRMRIKIWNSKAVVYDNGGSMTDNDEPITEIGAGSIVIFNPAENNSASGHIGNSESSGEDPAEGSTGNEVITLSAYPNPMKGIGTITFVLGYSAQITLKIYDLNGRVVSHLYQGKVEKGKEYKVKFSSNKLRQGVYIYRITTDTGEAHQKQLLIN